MVLTPSCSGNGQNVYRCPKCRVALWSNYSGAGDKAHFVRVGTLDEPFRLKPDMHIYTSSKQPWVIIPEQHIAFEEYYDPEQHWPKESLERRNQM